MINDFFFFVSEAFIGMRRSALMIAISVATITVSLLIFGLFLLVSLNVTHLGDSMASKLEIRLYLSESITKRERLTMQDQIQKMSQVDRVVFVSRGDAWEHLNDQYPSMGLSGLLDDNPLPDSFRVFLIQSEQIAQVAGTLESMFKDMVDDVNYGGTLAEQIHYLSRMTRLTGVILVTLFTLATLLIVMNTIRLTVIARQIEIEIMQLVGATNSFVRWPFIIEGLFIGLMGAGISVMILSPAYSAVIEYIQLKMPYFPIVVQGQMIVMVYLALLVVGLLLGVMGAFIAVSRSLKTTLES